MIHKIICGKSEYEIMNTIYCISLTHYVYCQSGIMTAKEPDKLYKYSAALIIEERPNGEAQTQL